jgi:superfamily II DNA or RNA helicase
MVPSNEDVPPPTTPLLRFASGTLLLEGLGRDELTTYFPMVPWIWDARVSAWRCDAFHYPEIRRHWRLQSANAQAWTNTADAAPPLRDEVRGWTRVVWPRLAMRPLRPEQQAAVIAWNKTRRGCVVMPTGTGKTEVALALMAQESVSTLVVAPVRDLMYQWHRRIEQSLGYDAGIIGDSLFRVKPVSVTTYESACIHMERLGDQFGFIVFDECHHLPGAVRRDAARMSVATRRLGLTATPHRADGRHVDLGMLIGPIAYELPLSAVRGQTLADYEIIRIPIHLTPTEQARYDRLSRTVRDYMLERRKEQPGFRWEDLCADSGRTPESRAALRAYLAKKAIEERAEEKLRVIEDLFRLHASEPCLIFAGSNAMARDVSVRFLIPCLLNHCRKKERSEILRGLENGDYRALVANQVLDEGVDLPAVKVAIVIGGSSSTRQAQQRLGRVLRRSGGLRAVLYEVVCVDTTEEARSRRRRGTAAFAGTKNRRPTTTPGQTTFQRALERLEDRLGPPPPPLSPPTPPSPPSPLSPPSASALPLTLPTSTNTATTDATTNATTATTNAATTTNATAVSTAQSPGTEITHSTTASKPDAASGDDVRC